MEKVLRKVKCAERLPEIPKYYWTSHGEILFDSTKRWLHNIGNPRYDVEYWYEEVDIQDLLAEMSPLRNSVLKLLAKERYEKAKEFITSYHGLVSMNPYVETQICFKALKIAAGLQEE